MKTELAPTSSDLSLLPRADLPVIWDGFAAKAEQLRTTAETLTVTSVEQKAEMELARTTRLTLKQIRVEVEKKRVELGEGHLTEIQKINGAAKKLKELIEPLEARLLEQETFADRAETARIAELSRRRSDEIRSIRPGIFVPDVGSMKQPDYDAYLARLLAEVAEIEEAKRRQAEAEAKLAEQAKALRAEVAEMEAKLAAERAEAKRQEEEFLTRLAAERAEENARQAAQLAAEREEQKLRDDEAKRTLAEAWAEARRVEQAVRDEATKLMLAQQIELKAESDRRLAAEEAKRLELEVQLANERAAKLAEERRLHALAIAPDKEQLKAFHNSIYQVPQPDLKTPEAVAVFQRVQCKIAEAFLFIDVFCAE